MLWITVLSVSTALSMVIVLVFCICWKRSHHKDEWLGLDGMVKQKNPDENVNHIPLPATVGMPNTSETQNVAEFVANPVILITAAEEVQSNSSQRRSPNQGSNTHRSLPDIPSEGQNRSAWEAQNGDNSSDLYATLEPYAARKLEVFQDNAKPSTSKVNSSEHSNTHDDSCSPYASVNYDKLKGVEHPYAIVKSPKTANNVSNETNDDSVKDPESLDTIDSASTGSNHNINAASAVAGGVAASQDLPYMTPPINIQPQINFSGDSQDSSKGYTSISVREPLANIMAHTAKESLKNPMKRLDPHYSTVSDDSDEMYTTIPDSLNQEYTSGSDTYAQIQPVVLTVAAEINHVPEPVVAAAPVEEYQPPQPPSVDSLKNMTGSHSRQDDRESFTASATSLTFTLGSPKPEKRQANSPLPPPPKTPDSSRRFLTTVANNSATIDEMYAKVQKNRKRKSNSSSSSSEIERKVETNASEEHNYETLKRSPQKQQQSNNNSLLKTTNDGYETLSVPGNPGDLGKDCYDDPNYEKLKDTKSNSKAKNETFVNDVRYSVVNKSKKHNYETICKSDPEEPNYESVKYSDVSYENVSNNVAAAEEEHSLYAGYETVDSSNSSNDISNRLVNNNYVKLNNDDETLSDTEESSSHSGYERIKQNQKYNDIYYETIKSKRSERGSCEQQQQQQEEDDNIFEV